MFKFKKGEIVKDKVTGFEGVIMVRSDYYTGCNTYGLLSQETNESGTPKDWVWIDETLLDKTEKKNIFTESEKPDGGPHPNAPQI
jgi:heat shock protein HspQ